MHNFDRTTLETGYNEFEHDEYEHDEFESDEFEYGEYEGDHENYGGMYGETYAESPFSEAEEMELAAELLSVNSEAELDQFLGKLFKRASRAVGGFLRSPIGNQLIGIVKGAAKQALPMVGNALLPGAGGALASQWASKLGLELEGLSQEDQEFEMARQMVRFGGAAASNAMQSEQSAPPAQAAQQAAVSAAQQYAPGLLKPEGASQGAPAAGRHRCRHRRQGVWFRQGNKIILIGA